MYTTLKRFMVIVKKKGGSNILWWRTKMRAAISPILCSSTKFGLKMQIRFPSLCKCFIPRI